MLTLELQKREMFPLPNGNELIRARARGLAMLSLALWGGTILAGRLLAYTHSILMATDPY
jgi:hypothetical protein